VRVGIVGCGLIGQKRSQALGSARVTACADRDLGRAQALATRWWGARGTAQPDSARDVDFVIVATPHDAFSEHAESAVVLPEMGPPETTAWEYPMADDSWTTEFAEFLEDIRLGRQPVPGLRDALEALRVVGIIYQESSHAHHT
jgi:predicted dehydrogenase